MLILYQNVPQYASGLFAKMFYTSLDKENYKIGVDKCNNLVYYVIKAWKPYYLKARCSIQPLTEKITYET